MIEYLGQGIREFAFKKFEVIFGGNYFCLGGGSNTTLHAMLLLVDFIWSNFNVADKLAPSLDFISNKKNYFL